jgi:hypothetical protein
MDAPVSKAFLQDKKIGSASYGKKLHRLIKNILDMI